MFKFKAAIVGHSQVPKQIDDLPSRVELDIYRSPGARALGFFSNERLIKVFDNRYDFVILWIGSNDIHLHCSVAEIAHAIKNIVDQLLARCTPRVRICLIEPRATEARWKPLMEQETYNKIAKGINNKLQKRLLKGKEVISFGAKPFWYFLRSDGVHFTPEGKLRVVIKLRAAICRAFIFQPEAHWGYSQVTTSENQDRASTSSHEAGACGWS